MNKKMIELDMLTLISKKEVPEIQCTKDYSLFKFDLPNRNVYPDAVEKLVESIKNRNKLKYHPVIVNGNYSVIDGQHRIKAAEKLNTEVFYVIDVDGGIKDITCANVNQKTWKMEDYVNFYCSSGISSYIKCKNIIEKFKINISVFNSIAPGSARGGFGNTRMKQGKFVLTDQQERDLEIFLDEVFPFLNRLKLYMDKEQRTIIKTRFFFRALHEMRKFFPDEFLEILDALEKDFFKITVRMSALSYMHLFVSIYNQQHRKKIHLEKEL
jgi:ParB-like nuclease domain